MTAFEYIVDARDVDHSRKIKGKVEELGLVYGEVDTGRVFPTVVEVPVLDPNTGQPVKNPVTGLDETTKETQMLRNKFDLDGDHGK